MTCSACDSQPSGLSQAGCRQCTLREIVRSPEHARARAVGKLTAEYMALLAPLGDPVTVHLTEIKPMVLRGEA